MKIVAKTDKGHVRADNQDSYAAGEFTNGDAWAVVCDGMGGASGGNIASAIAVKTISEKLQESYRADMTERSIRNMIESAIVDANLEIFDMAVKNPHLTGMGTTVVCVVMRNEEAFVAHVGDSRAYLLTKDTIQQITKDHSVVQTLLEKGQLTADEAKSHPSKNIITRALGVENRVKIDFDQVDINDQQAVLLCTDGLSNFIDENQIHSLVSDGKYYAFADRLVNKANENGGGDNITVVIVSK